MLKDHLNPMLSLFLLMMPLIILAEEHDVYEYAFSPQANAFYKSASDFNFSVNQVSSYCFHGCVEIIVGYTYDRGLGGMAPRQEERVSWYPQDGEFIWHIGQYENFSAIFLDLTILNDNAGSSDGVIDFSDTITDP